MNSKRILFDGATGTELNRRGVDTGLPLWSANVLTTATGLPTWVTFVCDKKGRILSGESLTHAAEILMPLGVKAMGVNCMPTHTPAQPLTELRAICGENFPLMA